MCQYRATNTGHGPKFGVPCRATTKIPGDPLKTRPFIAVGAITLAAALALSGCATRGSATAGTAVQAATRTTCDAKGVSQGITASTIKLGMFTPLTGPAATPGNGALAGFQFALSQVNAAGGVKGRKVQVVVKDDQYNAAVAQADARELNTSDNVFAFAGGVGTPNFVGVLPYIKQNQIPAIGPYAPSNQVGVMANPDVYMIWPNFTSEFSVATRWMMQNEPIKSAALVQLVGDTGDNALTGIKQGLAGTGVKLTSVQTVQANTTDFTSIAQTLKSENPQMVMTILNQVGQLIAAMHQIGYYPRLLAQSDMTDETWLAAYGSSAEGMIFPTKVASFASTDPLIQNFVTKFTASTGKAPTMWNAVGYTQAEVTLKALADSKALTRDCLEVALQNMKGFKTGFIPPVTFSANSRQGTNAVGVAKLEKGKAVPVAPFQPVK